MDIAQQIGYYAGIVIVVVLTLGVVGAIAALWAGVIILFRIALGGIRRNKVPKHFKESAKAAARKANG